jgi:Kef-type K+ transport system membrane component KefB
MIDAVSQLGILLLLLLTGMETDLKLVRKVGQAAIGISVAGICLPFVCGFALGEFMPAGMLPSPDQRLIASLFLGTALSISSLKIVAMVVREMNFSRRNVGQVILASAVIDDTSGGSSSPSPSAWRATARSMRCRSPKAFSELRLSSPSASPSAVGWCSV